tara:strand:- start:12082 stop:13092 length:1011 start_codon:yes stop_codon:yes gene_type:complete
MNLVLVGHGSIGAKYKQSIIDRNFNLENFYIIENNSDLQNKLKKQGFNCFSSLDKLESLDINLEYGIVANWGPDHISSANKLIDLGCKKLIIEKPLSSRKDELMKFKERCSREQIFVTINQGFSSTNIIQVISDFADNAKLGSPVGTRIIGGSICLSTNGTHYFDLSCDILQSLPKTIISDLELDYINPRNENLVNIGGSAAFRMHNDKFIHASFTNKNSQSARVEIIYRNAVIEFQAGTDYLKIYKRNVDEIIKFKDKVTRCGSMFFEKNISFDNKKNKSLVNDALNNLLDDVNPNVSIERAEISVLMVLGAIQSHIEGKRIAFEEVKDYGILIS